MSGEQELSPRIGPLLLGLVGTDEIEETETAIADDPQVRRLAAAAAALSLIPNPTDAAGHSTGLEHRIIARAREVRAPARRRRLRPSTARRIVFTLLLAGALAAAGVFAWLAFAPEEPISGRAVALSDDGAAGVLLPRFEQRPFALVFWGLAEPDEGQIWQLWLVRESGEVTAGPAFTPNAEGRAAVPINPNTLESDDAPIGFAVSLDDPEQRAGETPARDAIRYQFALD